MRPVIVLLTDFGVSDPYVAQMKGAVLSALPEAALVDLCHDIPPFELARAAFFLEASRAHFPRGTVFTAVVDPGVGTARRIVALVRDGQTFVAPDNGLLGLVLAQHAPSDAADGPEGDATQQPEHGGNAGTTRAFDLSAHAAGADVSATFHGRDVFAPLAARLAAGEDPADLGPELDPGELLRLPWAEPEPGPSADQVRASVLHEDRFGNCLTNLSVVPWAQRFAPNALLTLTPQLGAGLALVRARAYADLAPGQLGLVAGSQGYLELCMNQASAADETGLAPGETVAIGPAKDFQE